MMKRGAAEMLTLFSILLTHQVTCSDLIEVKNMYKIEKSKVLSVKYGNLVFIQRDEISSPNSFDDAEDVKIDELNGVRVLNVIHKKDKKLRFRKEVAAYGDGRLEISVKMRFFPYTDNSDPKIVSYSFFVPGSILNGMEFTAISGRAHSCREIQGRYNANGKDCALISQCRYVSFHDKERGYTFDFNPTGPGSRKDWSEYGEPTGYWKISQEGKFLRFSFSSKFQYYGGLGAGKVVIYDKPLKFNELHATTRWSYDGNNGGSDLQLAFGAETPPDNFIKEGVDLYSSSKGWGWKNNKELNLSEKSPNRIIDNCVYSSHPAEFIVELKPGCYLTTLRCGRPNNSTGPFDISVNGKLEKRDITTLPGEYRDITIATYLKAPRKRICLRFSGKGDWALNSLIVQAIAYQNEDFGITRGFWIVNDLFSPDITIENTREQTKKDETRNSTRYSDLIENVR